MRQAKRSNGCQQDAMRQLAGAKDGPLGDVIECDLGLAWLAFQNDDVGRVKDILTDGGRRGAKSLRFKMAEAVYSAWMEGVDEGWISRFLGEATELSEQDRPRFLHSLTKLAAGLGNVLPQKSKEKPQTSRSDSWIDDVELAYRGKETERLNQLVKEIERLDGQNAIWQFGRAAYLALTPTQALSNRSFARRHLAMAREMEPRWACVPFLAGEVEMHDEPDIAATHFVNAIRLGESRPFAVRHILRNLLRTGQIAAFHDAVQCVAQQPIEPFAVLGGESIEAAIPRLDIRLAGRSAQQAATANPSVDNWLWLAQIQEILGLRSQQNGNPDRAKDYFAEAQHAWKQAGKLSPSDFAVFSYGVELHLATGQTEQAREWLKTAKSRPVIAEELIAIASGWELLGESEEAAAAWESLLRSATRIHQCNQASAFFERTRTEGRLKKNLEAIVGGQSRPAKAVQAWSRRKLAWLLTLQGSTTTERAIRLLDQNLTEDPGSQQDRQLKAFCLVSAGQTVHRDEAIRVLEQSLSDDWLAVPTKKNALIQLCLANHDFNRVRHHLDELIAYFPNDPAYRVTLVRVLLESGEGAQAESEVRRLESLLPGSLSAYHARAEWLFFKKDYSAVCESAKQWASSHRGTHVEAVLDGDRVAGVLEHFASRLRVGTDDPLVRQFEELARKIRSDIVKNAPNACAFLSSQLVDRGRIDDALELLETSQSILAPEALATATMAPLIESAVPPQINRSKEILLVALERAHRSAPLLVATAFAHSRAKEHDQSEALLREAVRKDAANVPALNNLAMQLALQNRQLDEALDLIQKAISLGGTTPPLLDTRALVYCARNQLKDALTDIESACAKAPSPVYWHHKAAIFEKMNDSTKAGECDRMARDQGLNPSLLHPLDRNLPPQP